MNVESISFCNKDHFRILKSIAILAVMLSHAGNNSGVSWFTPLGGIGVAIFLFCSGYGIAYSAERHSPKVFFLKRLMAVYVEFFLIELFSAIIYSRSIWNVLLDLIFFRLSHVYYWYLRYLLVCYFIVWSVLYFVKNRKSQTLILLSVAGISFIAFYITKNNLYAEQSLSFVCGVWLTRHMSCGVSSRKLTLIGVLLLALGGSALFAKQLPLFRTMHSELMIPLNLVLKSATAGGVICISFLLRKPLRFLMPIGDISYSLYLIHAYTIVIVSNVMCGNWVISAIVFFAITFAISVVWYWLITKIKISLARKLRL